VNAADLVVRDPGAGGTISVKDELTIEFDIAPAR
jgi:hypothetical protein